MTLTKAHDAYLERTVRSFSLDLALPRELRRQMEDAKMPVERL